VPGTIKKKKNRGGGEKGDRGGSLDGVVKGVYGPDLTREGPFVVGPMHQFAPLSDQKCRTRKNITDR